MGSLSAWGADSDFYSGVAYLRAGDLVRAEQDLVRFRGDAKGHAVRASIDRALKLMKEPLPDEVREYIAATLEEARTHSGGVSESIDPCNVVFTVFQ